MIYYIICLIVLVIAVFYPKRKKLDEDSPQCLISLQEEFNKLLKENIKENQMTEEPVSHAEVLEMTKREFCELYDNSRVKHYIK